MLIGNARARYFLAATLAFGLLVGIEREFRGGFIRFTVGDFLVVVFLYLLAVGARPSIRPVVVGLGVLVFAIGVEISQLIDFAGLVGLPDARATRVVFGNAFSWLDIGAYILGAVFAVVGDTMVRRMSSGASGRLCSQCVEHGRRP